MTGSDNIPASGGALVVSFSITPWSRGPAASAPGRAARRARAESLSESERSRELEACDLDDARALAREAMPSSDPVNVAALDASRAELSALAGTPTAERAARQAWAGEQ